MLLLRWKGTGDWCLPGGRIRYHENLDTAAHRSLRERTGLGEIFLQPFHTFGDAIRFNVRETFRKLDLTEDESQELDRRDISVGYYALVDFATVLPTPDSFTEECRWCDIDQLPALLFDP